jgi:hypothetical protein
VKIITFKFKFSKYESSKIGYTTERFQVNVYEVYLEFKNILSAEENVSNPHVINLLSRLEELFTIFCKEYGIEDDWSVYNKKRVGLIDSSNTFWFTWFVFELACFKISKITIHLNSHYNKAEDKSIFLSKMYDSINLLINMELNILEPKIDKISNWIESKEYILELNKASQNKRIKLACDDEVVYDYFNKLVIHEKLTSDQVDKLIRANFEFGIEEKRTPLIIKLDKSHLTYFIKKFFDKHYWNDSKTVINTSIFLMQNFALYNAELNNMDKLRNLRKNLSKGRPAKYELDLNK